MQSYSHVGRNRCKKTVAVSNNVLHKFSLVELVTIVDQDVPKAVSGVAPGSVAGAVDPEILACSLSLVSCEPRFSFSSKFSFTCMVN